MKTLAQQLTQYARYHRDPRNIATHFVGIPMIVLAITVLLSRPVFELAGLSITPAIVLVVVSSLYYLALNAKFGALMVALMTLCVWGGSTLASGSTSEWLGWGIGLFVVGWIFQFIGHFYEGKKPAFVDDLIGLMIGPLFVVAEALFMLGLLKPLKAEIESGAGPVAIQDKTSAKVS